MHRPPAIHPSGRDPRFYQIAVLAGLLAYGWLRLRFDLPLGHAIAILATVLIAQYACGRLWRLPRFDPKSALISGLSLCLLLRTNSIAIVILAAVLAVASKFLIRFHGKHLFNPTNFALVVLLILTDRAWVSAGQWGSTAFFGFLVACLGGFVVNRALRSDVTLAFLGTYAGLLVWRAQWLGDPLAIPLHQLQSGALVIFSFFMISDPKTTPDSRAGRVLFGILVALGAYFVAFRLFRTNGLLWSLAALSVTVPLIDRLLPGPRYSWTRPRPDVALDQSRKGELDETLPNDGRGAPARVPLVPARVGFLRLLRR